MHTVSTDCQALDALLDGGLESDAITLVFGEGGSGKTNLALQCARVAIAGGQRVAYVDTEGVSEKRLAQVFNALPDEGREGAIERLLFYKPFSIDEQEKMVKKTALLKDVGLIVVDSVNMHYRLHIDAPGGEKEAGQSLLAQLHHLTMHARRHHIPVLITGQVYGGEDATQPFARRTMEHLVKALVRFEKRPDGTRRATVLKHRSIEEGRQVRFVIGPNGLEDLAQARTSGSVGAGAGRGVGADKPALGTSNVARPSATNAAGTPQRLSPEEARARFERLRQAQAEAGDESGSEMSAASMADPVRHSTIGIESKNELESATEEEPSLDAAIEPGMQRHPAQSDPIPIPADTPPSETATNPIASGQAADAPSAPLRAHDDATDESDAPEGPATELMTETERNEAESLPGFTSANKIPRSGEQPS